MNQAALRRTVQRVGAAALALALSTCSSDSHTDSVIIRTLSNRADLVSGGDALVEIVLPQGTSAAGLKVDVGGRDISDAFAQRANGRVIGVVAGLSNGNNVLTAKPAGKNGASLAINNHPIGGPVFSGTQLLPWICATPIAQPATSTTPAANASCLGPPTL